MSKFRSHPDPSTWDDYVDFESTSWPKKDKRHYWIIPSICFNCESACGILAYVDKEQLTVRKIEGNPLHPGSRGRTCAKGVVTPNQLEDPDRILYPLRARRRARIRKVAAGVVGRGARATSAGGSARRSSRTAGTRSCITSAGRARTATPTACCRRGASTATTATPTSAPRRRGSGIFSGAATIGRRPTTRTRETILLLSSHLETGHYFNPHAQRIIEGQSNGATLIVDRSAPVEHVGQGEHVAAGVFGHRGRAAARDGEGDPRRGSLRPRVHARPGSTGAATCAPIGPISPSPSTTSSSR